MTAKEKVYEERPWRAASFSKQIDFFVFIFYPKTWSIPNMSVRHLHPGYPRKSYSLDEKNRCTGTSGYDRRIRCEAVCTDDMTRRAVHEMLGRYSSGHIPAFLKETVAFKGALKQLADEWYIRKYKNQYTKNETRYIFYHDCLKMASVNTFYKGTYDFLLPFLDVPYGCQVCGTLIPKGVQMAVRLQKANLQL